MVSGQRRADLDEMLTPPLHTTRVRPAARASSASKQRRADLRLSSIAICGVLGAFALGGGCGPATLPPDAGSGATTADTAAPDTIPAGTPFSVSCHFFDADGEERALPEGVTSEVVFDPEDAVELNTDGLYVATTVGSLHATCTTDGGSLRDETPASVRVTAGPASFTTIALDRREVQAGGPPITARCAVWDAYGNPVLTVATDPQLETSPSGFAEIDGLSASFHTAGRYTLSCALPGAETTGEVLTVLPGAAAELLLQVAPAQPFYARGDRVSVEHRVLDRFGNEVPGVVVDYTLGAALGIRALGAGQFALDDDGAYRVDGSVAGSTADAASLSASVLIRVSGSGPQISCDPHRYRVAQDGAEVSFRGRVADPNGIASLTVDGTPVSVAQDGSFDAGITAAFGMSFVEVIAEDAVGAITSRSCPIVIAGSYAAPDAPLPGVVSALLGLAAIDDGQRAGPIGSIADIMQTVVGSQGVADTADAFLHEAGEVLPSSCITRILGLCVNASADYAGGFRIDGPNDASMGLTDGGLSVSLTLRGLHLDLDLDIFGFIAVNGLEALLESLSLEMVLDAGVSGGAPSLVVRPGSLVTTQAGTLTADGTWVPDFLLDAVIDWIQEDIRGVIVARLEHFLPGILTQVVTDLFGAIDVNALDVDIVLPRLSGEGEPFVLSPQFEVSGVDATGDRLRLGVATAVLATPVHAHENPGIPLPAGEHYFDGAPDDPMDVAISAAIVNQTVNAVWRAGFLQLDGAEVLGAELPEGYEIDIEGTMPPIARLREDGSIEIGVGGLVASISLPGVFGEPLLADVGATASTTLDLDDGTLSVGDIVIEDLDFSIEGINLSGEQRRVLEGTLGEVVRTVVDTLLTDALPRLPIPSLPLPPSFERYGLPPGTEVGTQDPQLTSRGQHLYLRSGFGVR